MPLFDFLYHKSTREPPDQKAVATVQAVGIQKPLPPAAHDLEQLLRQLRHSEIAYACIRIKKKAMADPRLIVQQRQGDTYVEAVGHPLRRLIMRPMPDLDETAFIGTALASIDIAGVFFAEKVRSHAGAIVGLNPINPLYMTPRKDASGTLNGYTYTRGSYRVDFALEDLLIRDLRSWDNPPPLAVAVGAIDLDRVQTDFARAYFNNGGQPSGILKKSGVLRDQDEARSIQAQWAAKYGRGGNGYGAPAVLDDNMSYERVGSFLHELDNETLRMFSETRVCMAFGVPPLIVYTYAGIVKSTYSNLKEAWANFWDAELSPTLKEWRSFFTWALLSEFVGEDAIWNEQYRLYWDLSAVASMQEDVDAVQARAERAFRAGGMTLNEYRMHLGLPTDTAGDYYLRLLAYAPYDANSAPTVDANDVLAGKTDQPPAKARSVNPAHVTAFKAVGTAPIERRVQREIHAAALQTYAKLIDQVRQEAA
ncbi:MAG TPA: phage portal protein [Roseiflexaceae bacterium]|nr:phage portal protein [Roseiflexaceae bacterium]